MSGPFERGWRTAMECAEGIARDAVGSTPLREAKETCKYVADLISNDARRGPPCDHGPGVPMLLWCPECGERHVDEGEFETKPHHTHACQHCGHVWRPAIERTVGVRFLSGFGPKVTP